MTEKRSKTKNAKITETQASTLVLITNRKSYMSFGLVPQSVTLNGVMAVTLFHWLW